MCVYFRSHVHLHLDECPKRMMKCSVAGCNNFYQLGMENAHNELYQGSHQALLKSQVESLQRAIYDKVCWSHLGDSFSSITIEILFIQLEFRCFRFYLLLFLTFNNNNNNNNNNNIIIIIVVFLNIVIIIICSLKLPWKGSFLSESATGGQCRSRQSEFQRIFQVHCLGLKVTHFGACGRGPLAKIGCF